MIEHPITIALFGCGAVGLYYGARLASHGNKVYFLLRSDYDVIRRQGIIVESCTGNFVLESVNAIRDSSALPQVDLVIIAAKTTVNHDLPRQIKPCMGDQTSILTLQNGLGNEEFFASHFGSDRVMGGLCFVCINRTAPGKVKHTAHGQIVMGRYGKPIDIDTRQLASEFQDSGIPCRVTDNLSLARWQKLVWNIPFNGLSVAEGSIDVSRILKDSRLVENARQLMSEVVETANALGYRIEREYIEENIQRTLQMGAYEPSTLIDFKMGREIEVESLFGEPLRAAQKVGISTPHLEKLYRKLVDLNPVSSP